MNIIDATIIPQDDPEFPRAPVIRSRRLSDH
ncbi:hypothetical protein PM8797T_08349 [Gimesia maris DSM 8797]|nr:hypothetical protein PM8797T_08349 [Gimesia maris DSM 8797]